MDGERRSPGCVEKRGRAGGAPEVSQSPESRWPPHGMARVCAHTCALTPSSLAGFLPDPELAACFCPLLLPTALHPAEPGEKGLFRGTVSAVTGGTTPLPGPAVCTLGVVPRTRPLPPCRVMCQGPHPVGRAGTPLSRPAFVQRPPSRETVLSGLTGSRESHGAHLEEAAPRTVSRLRPGTAQRCGQGPGVRPLSCRCLPHRRRTERGRTELARMRAELGRELHCDTDRRPPWHRQLCWPVTLTASTGSFALPQCAGPPRRSSPSLAPGAASLALTLFWLCPFGIAFPGRQPLECVVRPGPGPRHCHAQKPLDPVC